jgi:hypothetical protein
LRTGRSSPTLRGRIENLLQNVQSSPALHQIEVLKGLEDFTQLYLKFCELALHGDDTETIIREMRQYVKDELKRSNQRAEEFNGFRKRYDGQRR